jgi:homoserine kinase type II
MAAGYQVETGYHAVADALRTEAIRKFFPREEADAMDVFPTTGGINNVGLRLVAKRGGAQYVLRVYNNGKNAARVAYEHRVLDRLRAVSSTLSFRVPEAIPVLNGTETFAELSDGSHACVFPVIPGRLASNELPESIGRACGELEAALAHISAEFVYDATSCPNAPYFDIWRVHHAASAESFHAAIARTDWFDSEDTEVNRNARQLADRVDAVVAKTREYHGVLPLQLIHGDLHYDNVLVDGGRVTALLDFEFCAVDWRAMELAICLSKYMSDADPMAAATQFSEGDFVGAPRHTMAELAAVPTLIALRILSNVVYFVARAVAGEDTINAITSRVSAYLKRVQWLEANETGLRSMLVAAQGASPLASSASVP